MQTMAEEEEVRFQKESAVVRPWSRMTSGSSFGVIGVDK